MANNVTPGYSTTPLQESSIGVFNAYTHNINAEMAFLDKGGTMSYSMRHFLTMMGIFRNGGTFNNTHVIHLESEPMTPWMRFSAPGGGNVPAPAAGASITIEITAPYAPDGSCQAQLNSLYSVGTILGKCTAVGGVPGAVTLTLAPISGNFPAYLANSPICHLLVSVGEAATHINSKTKKYVAAFDHPFMKVRDGVTIKDFAALRNEGRLQTKVMATPWTPGKTSTVWETVELAELWQNLEDRLAYQFILGDRQRVGTRAAGAASYSDGLLAFLLGSSNRMATPAGPMSMQYFYDCSDLMFNSRLLGSTGTVQCMVGRDWARKARELGRQETVTGNYEQDGATYKVAWKAIDVGDRVFEWTPIDEFSDPARLGQYGHSTTAIMMPDSATLNPVYGDGVSRPCISLKYFNNENGVQIPGTNNYGPKGQLWHMTSRAGHSDTANNGSAVLDADQLEIDVTQQFLCDFRVPEAFLISY
jgi:hypothetical protein